MRDRAWRRTRAACAAADGRDAGHRRSRRRARARCSRAGVSTRSSRVAPDTLPRVQDDRDRSRRSSRSRSAVTLADRVDLRPRPGVSDARARAAVACRRCCASPAAAASNAGITRSSSPSWRWRRCCSSARGCCSQASSHRQRVELGFADRRPHRRRPESRAGSVSASRSSRANFSIDTTPKMQFVERRARAAAATPGVRAAAASFTSPLTGAPNRGISIPGRPEKGPGLEDNADFQVITPDFFRTIGATLVRGRAFAATDQASTPPVAIVNQAFADRYFRGEDPIGRRMQFGGNRTPRSSASSATCATDSSRAPPIPTFYIPITQNDERWPFLSFTVWSDGDAAARAPMVRDAIRRADPNQAVTRIRTYRRDRRHRAGAATFQYHAGRRSSPSPRCCSPPSAPTA